MATDYYQEEIEGKKDFYSEEVDGKIPPFQKILGSLRKAKFGPYAFMPLNRQEAADIPTAMVRGVNTAAFGLPEMISKQTGGEAFPEPQTDYGREMTAGAEWAPGLAALGTGVPAGVNALKGFMKAKKLKNVQKIQEAFNPWKRKHYGEYGRARKAAMKGAIQEGNMGVTDKTADAIFGDLKYNKDAWNQLPKKAKDEITRVYKAVKDKKSTIEDLEKASARLRRSISSAERTGRVSTENSRAIQGADSRLHSYLEDVLPGMKQAKTNYAPFSKVRDIVKNKFEPQNLRYGTYGADKARYTLKNIKKQPEGVMDAFRTYEKETGLNFINPAKKAATWRGIGTAVKQATPAALMIGGGLGLGGYTLGKVLNKFVPGD